MFRLYDPVSIALVLGLILLLEHKTCISEKQRGAKTTWHDPEQKTIVLRFDSTRKEEAQRNFTIRYISTEHPKVTDVDNKYVTYANLTSRRYGRGNPLYYVGLHLYMVWPFDNNISVDFYFYELLSNRYKQSFVEMHFKLCDLIHKDPFFGAALKQGKLNQPCPFPAGAYHMYNMTIPLKQIPFNFPFTKGRIQANATVTATRELIASGHIDMEIKEVNLGRRKKGKSIYSEV